MLLVPPFMLPTMDGREVRGPLSVNVDQTINPWTWFLRFSGVDIGQLNVYLGDSANPALERQILETAGTYGCQIGQIGGALMVVLRRTNLTIWKRMSMTRSLRWSGRSLILIA